MVSARLKRAFSLVLLAGFVLSFCADAYLNSPTYRDRYGSELLMVLPVGLGAAFWIWMLIDLMTKISRGEQIGHPWLWTVFVVLTYVVGAFVYYVVVFYRSLSSQHGARDPAS